MPLVTPLKKGSSAEVDELARFFDETLGFTPNSVLTMQHRPGIAQAFINLNKAVKANEARVTAKQKRPNRALRIPEPLERQHEHYLGGQRGGDRAASPERTWLDARKYV